MSDPVMMTRMLPTDSASRKRFPIVTGLLDYFPDALAAVSEVSFIGNSKHNPGQSIHWARGKSADHADCIGRHLIERGGFETIKVGEKEYEIRHSAALAWRALASLQEELEAVYHMTPSRGSRFDQVTPKPEAPGTPVVTFNELHDTAENSKATSAPCDNPKKLVPRPWTQSKPRGFA